MHSYNLLHIDQNSFIESKKYMDPQWTNSVAQKDQRPPQSEHYNLSIANLEKKWSATLKGNLRKEFRTMIANLLSPN